MHAWQKALLEGTGMDLCPEEQDTQDKDASDYKANVFRHYGREPGDITQMRDSMSPLASAVHNWAETSHVSLEQSDRKEHPDGPNTIEPLEITHGHLNTSLAVSSSAPGPIDTHETTAHTPPRETVVKNDPTMNASLLRTPRTSVRSLDYALCWCYY